MKTLTISKIRYQNFKGLKDFTLEPCGQDITVLGKNGTGKTTLSDGFSFLLFGQDSLGRKDFEILTVDDNNQVEQTEAQIEAVLSLDNKPVTLLRRYKQKHTKKRGEAKKTFTGHTFEFEIDGVPSSKTAFDKKVAEILDINAFKLVTNPYEFNLIPWAARRNLLMEICGDVPDSEVISSDQKLAELAEMLGNQTVDDLKTKAAAQKAKINKKLEEIPARIDEQKRGIQDTSPPDPKEKARLERTLEEAETKLRELKSNEALAEKQVRFKEVEAGILQSQNQALTNASVQREPTAAKIRELEAEAREFTGRIESLKDAISRDEKRNKIISESLESLRTEWKEISHSKRKGDDTCPSCGQALPHDQVQNVVMKFNQEKARKLEKNQTEGKRLAKDMSEREKSIQEARAEIYALTQNLKKTQAEIKKLNTDLSGLDVKVDPSILEPLKKEKAALESDIAALKNGAAVREKTAREDIEAARAALSTWSKTESAYEASQASRNRVAELKQKEKDLAAEFEALEHRVFLTEQFIVRKVEMLEGNINSRFKLARFKMFEKQINGGVKECCETLFNGVPYNHGLNSAARINVGLDIIHTLSEHFGFRAPIFIDNSESVNDIVPIPSQVISLAVSEDEELTVSAAEIRQAS